MLTSTKTRRLMAERGVLDTSVVVDLDTLDRDRLPRELAISAITLAELAAGPHAAGTPAERARRQEHLQRTEAMFDPLPFDLAAARAYGRICSVVFAAGGTAQGARAVDLLIAATALAHGLPLVTRNSSDLRGLEDLVEVIAV